MPRAWMKGFVCLVVALVAMEARGVPAFPEAEGHGASAVGGRRGKVLFVTSLADSGPGTLRAALDSVGKRTVVFRVGGTITLQSPLVIRNPYVTVAGQTAPGGGIQLRNDPVAPQGLAADSFTSLEIATHDVVIRYLRIRPGPLNPNPACTGRNALGTLGAIKTCVDAGDIQAIELEDAAERVMLDHLSLYWSSDELIDINGANDVTLQWSILAEPINFVLYEGFHVKKNPYNGHGIIIGGAQSAALGERDGRLAIHHNLFALLADRAPQMNVNCPSPSAPLACASDVVNNYIYDWRYSGALVSNLLGHAYVNVVGNYFRDGRDTEMAAQAFKLIDWGRSSSAAVKDAKLGIHQLGNVWRKTANTHVVIQPLCTRWNQATGRFEACNVASYSKARWGTPPITTSSAITARDQVLTKSGASLRLDGTAWRSARDATDARVVSDATNGGGRIIDSLAEFPGWPTLANGPAATDADKDGMADAWERGYCLDAGRSDHALDPDGDGYTNLEEFLNGTRPCGG